MGLLVVQITAPVGLDFGFCTVNEESARTFELVNVGQVLSSLVIRASLAVLYLYM